MPAPSSSGNASQITCRVLIDGQVYLRDLTIPDAYKLHNTDLLVAYFTQLQDKITLAKRNNPPAAEVMQACALASIPSTVLDRRLLALRQSFIPPQTVLSLLEEDLINTSAQSPWRQSCINFGHTFFSSAARDDVANVTVARMERRRGFMRFRVFPDLF